MDKRDFYKTAYFSSKKNDNSQLYSDIILCTFALVSLLFEGDRHWHYTRTLVSRSSPSPYLSISIQPLFMALEQFNEQKAPHNTAIQDRQRNS